MELLVYIVCQIVCWVLGGLFIKFAIDNYQKEQYFMFGSNLMMVANYLIVLVYIHLNRWGVL